MKKILHVLASNSFSGAENVASTIIKSFENEYECAYTSPDGEIRKELDKRNVKFLPMHKVSIRELKSIIKEFNPDILHAHDYKASCLCALSGFKGKIISHIHINSPIVRSYNIKSILYLLVQNRFDKIIGVSSSVYDEMIFNKKIKNKYVTINNYVDKDLIINKSLLYKSNKKYDIVYFGRLNKYKGPIEAIEIIKNIKQNNKDIKVAMIGDGDLKNECEALIKTYQLENNIDMLGFLSNPFPIIKDAKVCIMPSNVEGFGLTAIETLILGVPVLNSAVGGLKEIFSEKKELICSSINDYAVKYEKFKDVKEDYTALINKYTNKIEWKKRIKEIYK